tara:strand:- start:144 stop:389 length:246 start_codon:yes stop_codon:yes gene_type:complete
MRREAEQRELQRKLDALDESANIADVIYGASVKRPGKAKTKCGIGGFDRGYTANSNIPSGSCNYGARDMRDRITEAREAVC